MCPSVTVVHLTQDIEPTGIAFSRDIEISVLVFRKPIQPPQQKHIIVFSCNHFARQMSIQTTTDITCPCENERKSSKSTSYLSTVLYSKLNNSTQNLISGFGAVNRITSNRITARMILLWVVRVRKANTNRGFQKQDISICKQDHIVSATMKLPSEDEVWINLSQLSHISAGTNVLAIAAEFIHGNVKVCQITSNPGMCVGFEAGAILSHAKGTHL